MEQAHFRPVSGEANWRDAHARLDGLKRQNPQIDYTVDADDYVRLRRLG